MTRSRFQILTFIPWNTISNADKTVKRCFKLANPLLGGAPLRVLAPTSVCVSMCVRPTFGSKADSRKQVLQRHSPTAEASHSLTAGNKVALQHAVALKFNFNSITYNFASLLLTPLIAVTLVYARPPSILRIKRFSNFEFVGTRAKMYCFGFFGCYCCSGILANKIKPRDA